MSRRAGPPGPPTGPGAPEPGADDEATEVRAAPSRPDGGPPAGDQPDGQQPDGKQPDERAAAEAVARERLKGGQPAGDAGDDDDDGGAGGKAKAPPSAATVGKAVWQGLRDTGAPLMRFLEMVGGHLILTGRALSWLPRRPFRWRNYLEAGEYIGFGSLPIVLLVGAFTGMVLSLQSVYAFGQLGFESFSGAATGKALSIELAPVLTSLMLAGRAGAGIATELGTMRISEQIDALESMAVNPVQFLVLPRLIAGMLVTPILTLLFFVIGMGGAYFVAIIIEGVDQGQWVAKLRDLVEPIDVIQGLIKSVVFGFLVTLIGCFQGYNASGGGRGVGMGTTRAVVMGSVSTLILDYFLTDVLLSIFGTRGDA